MITTRADVAIRRPIEEVYDFLADATNDHLWCPPVSEVRRLDTEDGVARFEAVAKPGPTQVTNRFEIRTPDRPHRIEWRGANETARFDGHYELKETDGGTRLSMVSNLDPSFPMKLLTPVIALMSRSNARKQFEHLKRGLENQHWAIDG